MTQQYAVFVVLHASLAGTYLSLLFWSISAELMYLQTLLAEQVYDPHRRNTACTLKYIRPCLDPSRDHLQVSDFMNDEEGTQELCRHAARWLFGCQGAPLPKITPDVDSDQAQNAPSAPSEYQILVRCCLLLFYIACFVSSAVYPGSSMLCNRVVTIHKLQKFVDFLQRQNNNAFVSGPDTCDQLVCCLFPVVYERTIFFPGGVCAPFLSGVCYLLHTRDYWK